MATFNDLSEYERYQLKSLDPHLTQGWQKVLFNILPKLDKASQQSVLSQILAPKGIFYDKTTKKFDYERPKTLIQAVAEHKNSPEFQELLPDMQSLINTAKSSSPTDALAFADTLEAILVRYDGIALDNDAATHAKREIRQAFLYDIASWIDSCNLQVSAGMRQLNAQAAKSYLKEVYIRQQIQDLRFCGWDAEQIQSMESIPDWIKQSANERQYFIVETTQFWFLIGQSDNSNNNPYSFYRFLLELENEEIGGSAPIITHMFVPKSLLDNPKVVQFIQYCLSRIYVPEKKISKTIHQFVKESKEHLSKYLRPILREPLVKDGTDPEQAINTRMMDFEKQLTVLILQKIPRMVLFVRSNPNNQDFLFYHISHIIRQLSSDVEDFRLNTMTKQSVTAEYMFLRLVSYRILWHKLYALLCDNKTTEAQKTDKITEPLTLLEKELTSTEEKLRELDEYSIRIQEYNKRQQNPSLWRRIVNEQAPDYSLEDIKESKEDLTESLFVYIGHLHQLRHDIMVHPEHEFYQKVHHDYRHYALADGKMGIEKLPKLIRLPNSSKLFDIHSVRRSLYFDVLKTKQEQRYHSFNAS